MCTSFMSQSDSVVDSLNYCTLIAWHTQTGLTLHYHTVRASIEGWGAKGGARISPPPWNLCEAPLCSTSSGFYQVYIRAYLSYVKIRQCYRFFELCTRNNIDTKWLNFVLSYSQSFNWGVEGKGGCQNLASSMGVCEHCVRCRNKTSDALQTF